MIVVSIFTYKSVSLNVVCDCFKLHSDFNEIRINFHENCANCSISWHETVLHLYCFHNFYSVSNIFIS